MRNFAVPTRDQVSENNQAIFDNLEKGVGFVPNLFATFAYSDTALGDYLAFQNRKTSLIGKEKEVINLVVSEVNNCAYYKAAHTAIGKMNGFNEDQILENRSGAASFNSKFDALAKFVKETAINRGRPNPTSVENSFAAGYDQGNLVDILVVVGDKIISNYLHGITGVPVDFPAAPELTPVTV